MDTTRLSTAQRLVFLIGFAACVLAGLAMIVVGALNAAPGLTIGGSTVIAAGGGSLTAAWAAAVKKARG